jgi:hypothetical protein
MLYWAEGAKERNVVKFANSDVAMVRFFATSSKNALASRPPISGFGSTYTQTTV